MTTYLDFRPLDHASGTDMATLPGWSVYCHRFSADDIAGDPVAEIQIQGQTAQIVPLGQHHFPDYTAAMFDTGHPLTNAFVEIEADQKFAIGKDPSNYVMIRVAPNGSTLAIVMDDKPYVDGVQVDFPVDELVVQFAASDYLPSKLLLGLSVSGAQLSFTVNGIPLSHYYSSRPQVFTLPDALKDAQAIGFGSSFGGIGAIPARMFVSDGQGVLTIDSAKQTRISTEQSDFTLASTASTLAAGTAVTVTLHSSPDALDDTTRILGPYTATIDAAGAWSIVTDAIPKANEQTTIGIKAVDAAGDEAHWFAFVKKTLTPNPVRVGNNFNVISYYIETCPFRDLTKSMLWIWNGARVINEWVDEAWMLNDAARVKPSETNGDFCAELMPVGWGAGYPLALMFFEIDPIFAGKPTILTLPVGMDFHFEYFDDDAMQVDKNYYGPGKHRIIFSKSRFTLIDPVPRFEILPNPDYPNQGLPTSDWRSTFSWRLAGDTSPYILTEGFVNYYRRSGMQFIRFMKSQAAEESSYGEPLPDSMWTGDHRLKLDSYTLCPDDGTMQNLPFEAVVELCERAEKDMWICFIRGAHESYLRAFTDYVVSRPADRFKFQIMAAMSNEVWNFQYRANFGYYKSGLQQGLGKLATDSDPGAVYGSPEALYPNGLPADWNPDAAYALNDEVMAPNGSPYICLAAHDAVGGTADNNNAGAPSNDPTNWKQTQSGEAARWRAHKQDTLRMATILRAGLGDQASRVLVMAEVWFTGFIGSRIAEDYLGWGAADGSSGLDHISTAPYLDVLGDYSYGPYMTPALYSAAAGAERVAAFRSALLALVETNIDVQGEIRKSIEAKAAELKVAAPILSIYEMGNSLVVSGWPDQASDAALLADVRQVYDTVMPEVDAALVTGMAENIGGWICFFGYMDHISPYKFLAAPAASYGAIWSVTDTITEDTPAFLALRDAFVANGGTVLSPLTTLLEAAAQRRRQPINIRRLPVDGSSVQPYIPVQT